MNHRLHEICDINHLQYLSSQSVSGGDINEVFRVETNKGLCFMKINSADSFPQMFAKEAEGLNVLRKSTSLKVPEVLATGEHENLQYLLLQWLEKAPPALEFWKDFATGMAQLHQVSNPTFGWTTDNYIGSLKQANTPVKTWTEFYTNYRIMPLVEQLYNSSAFTAGDLKNAQLVCNHFESIFPAEPPALLHGDFWAGNFMAVKANIYSSESDGLPCIYDPAVYFGHREMDIGLSLLFGGFDPKFYDHYNVCFPLETNWKKRVQLTQLYPLLVHAVLFGGSYISQCKQIILFWK